jgi:hypothetical protein
MAIDAASFDNTAAARPVVARERDTSPVGSYGRDDGREGGIPEQSGEMSFWDFLDVINPLQHIPIVNTLYRNLTGDTIQPAARVMGGILYGGVVGGAAAIANAVVEQSSGEDLGDQTLAALGFGGDAHPAASVATAANAGGAATAASPAQPATPQAAPVLAAANPSSVASAAAANANQSANQSNVGAPIKLAAASMARPPIGAPANTAATASLMAANPQTSNAAAIAASKMPARDTPLASSTLVKHAAPKYAAPMPGSIPVNAQAASNVNGSPEALSETMMRNLAKYEQSRKAAQSAAPTMRVSS